MQKPRHALRWLFVTCLGLAVLLVDPPPAASDEGTSDYCTTDCDYSIQKHNCGVGTFCRAESCTGVDGVLYPFWVSCVQQE